MVSPVGISTANFLNQIQGTGAPAPKPAPASTPAPTPVTNTAGSTQSQVSSLLSNSNGFAPEVLSLLQANSSGNFDPITSLLGGASTDNGLTSVYANLFASASAAVLTEAKDNSPALGTTTLGTAPTADTAQNLISAQTQASVAYDKTLVQNAQSVATANNYGPDGVTPLVA